MEKTHYRHDRWLLVEKSANLSEFCSLATERFQTSFQDGLMIDDVSQIIDIETWISLFIYSNEWMFMIC